VSKHTSISGGASPARMKVLNVLKVCGFWLNAHWDGTSRSAPPFGALGFT